MTTTQPDKKQSSGHTEILQHALKQTNDRLRLVQSSCGIGVWSWDLLTGTLSVEPEFEELYGIAPGTLLHPDGLANYSFPGEPLRWDLEMMAALAENRPLNLEHRIRHASGEERWLLSKGRAEHDAAGRPVRISGVAVDITDRKRAEEQLKRNHDTFYNLIQNNPFGVYVVDADFKLREVSLGSQKVFSTVRPLLGRDFNEVLRCIWPEPFATEALDHFRRTLMTGEPYSAPATVQRRCDIGVIEAYDWRIERINLPDGRHGVVCYFYDLSERQRWEAALTESADQLRLVTDHVPVLIVQCDAQTRYKFVNAPYAERFGLQPELLIGKKISEVLGATVYESLRPHVEQALRGNRVEFEMEIPYEKPGPRWMYCIYVPEFCPGGEVEGFVAVVQDITARKQVEEALRLAQAELRTQNEKLEAAVHDRTAKLRETVGELEAFSYSIAHDMRAPLRAIHGLADLLQEEYSSKLDAEGRSFLQRMSDAVRRMDRLITDVLSYSRVVRADLVLEPVDTEKLLHAVVQSYPALYDSNAEILLEKPLPRVLGNEAMLTQCFSNLLGNAVKFVESGVRPKIRVSSSEEQNFTHLNFEDNGIGIQPADQEKIFKIFHRTHNSYDGTGIGLSIVKKAAERMGGTVAVDSTPGRGSRFVLKLQKAH